MGGGLYLMDLVSQEINEVEINVASDLALEIPSRKDVSGNIAHMTAAPGSKRVVFEARGELFNVPVSEGYSENLTRSSGAFDRHPAWSPDGETVAFWSDRNGEYEIYLRNMSGTADVRQLTNRGVGYGYSLYWSPDGNHLAFIDETNTIYVVNAENGTVLKPETQTGILVMADAMAIRLHGHLTQDGSRLPEDLKMLSMLSCFLTQKVKSSIRLPAGITAIKILYSARTENI
jgi:tricorn protease-like protein